MEGKDKVLNLSAFGDLIKNTKEVEKTDVIPISPIPPAIEPSAKMGPITVDEPIQEPSTLPIFELPLKVEEPIKSEDPNWIMKPALGSVLVNEFAHNTLAHSMQLRLFHWQTGSYAEHKALDVIFGGLIELSDTLLESIMGRFGRPTFNKIGCSIELSNYTVGELNNYIEEMLTCYEAGKKLVSLECSECGDILNILDEIIALINKTKYLLSLK